MGYGGRGQVEETDFICATAWSLQPCAPPGLQPPGAQVAVSRVGSGRWGDTGMGHIGAALGLSAAMESQQWAALPGSEQLL